MDAETKLAMREIAEEASEKAVRRTLTALGVDHDRPLETQKDLATLRELRELIDDPETQKDLLHLRRWRKAMDSVQSRGFVAAVGMVCVGGIALIVYAFRFKFGN